MLTQSDVDLIIKNWMESIEGKKHLRSLGVGVYTPTEMQAIALRLRNDIVSGFFSIQSTPLSSPHAGIMDMRYVTIQNVGENRLEIRFPPSALKRKSLMGLRGYTGGGINDIFALFTHGWSAKRYVYGDWYEAEQNGWRAEHTRRKDGFIRSRRYYPGNPWISHIITTYEMEYPGLSITYPAAWGGK